MSKITGTIILWIGVAMMTSSCTFVSSRADSLRANRLEQSPQFEARRFVNQKKWQDPTVSEFLSLLNQYLFGDQERFPVNPLPVETADLAAFHQTEKNRLSVTWLGHSSLMINMDGIRILTDPVFEKKVTILGPTRFIPKLPVNIEQVGNVDLVVISHNHYDHLNRFSIEFLQEKTGRFIVPLGVGETLECWGVPVDKIVELDWWETCPVNTDLQIIATPAQHFSGRGLLDRNKSLWASYVLQTRQHRIFFSGDSGYFKGFKQIGDKYGPFDVTFLECGAYNEKWRFIHMFPEETVQAHLDLKGKLLHPIHWATFNLALHTWYDPMERLLAASQADGVPVVTPLPGEMILLGQTQPPFPWWRTVAATGKPFNLEKKVKGVVK